MVREPPGTVTSLRRSDVSLHWRNMLGFCKTVRGEHGGWKGGYIVEDVRRDVMLAADVL